MIGTYALTFYTFSIIAGYVYRNYILPKLLPSGRYEGLNRRSVCFLLVSYLHCCIAMGDWVLGINLVPTHLWKLAVLEAVIFTFQMNRAVFRHCGVEGRGFMEAWQLDKLNAKRIGVTLLLLGPIVAYGHTPIGSLLLFVHSYYYCKTEIRMMECMTERQDYFGGNPRRVKSEIAMAFVCPSLGLIARFVIPALISMFLFVLAVSYYNISPLVS